MIESKKAQTNSSLIPEIANRWSPRAFADEPVPDEILKQIFEAARWAPSSRNEQPWRFILARKNDPHYDKTFACLNSFNQQWAFTAPVLVVVLAETKHAYKGRPNDYHMHDVGLAVGNLLAQATHAGIAAHQMGGINKEQVEQSFNIDTEKLAVVSMMALGYQDESRLKELDEKYQESEFKARERKDIGELVFGDGLTEPVNWS